MAISYRCTVDSWYTTHLELVCYVCLILIFTDPPTPKHVTLTGTWKNHGFYLFISWELAAVYNSPYPDETYYITISYEPNGMLAAPVLEVVGRVSHG